MVVNHDHGLSVPPSTDITSDTAAEVVINSLLKTTVRVTHRAQSPQCAGD